MVDILATPFLWVVATIALYAVAYWGYAKWIDRNVWRSDAKRATPAHMYMDGVEYFPTSRYVLWGYQFKSVAALGPILRADYVRIYRRARPDEPPGLRPVLPDHHLRHVHRPHCDFLGLEGLQG